MNQKMKDFDDVKYLKTIYKEYQDTKKVYLTKKDNEYFLVYINVDLFVDKKDIEIFNIDSIC